MRIAVIWYFDKASWVWPNWRDGHRAAFEEIAKEHEVEWFLDKRFPDPNEDWDAVILWDDSNSPFFDMMTDYRCKRAVCLTTDPHNIPNLLKADVVFCESTPVYEAVRRHGLHAIKAFGTDSDFFSPHGDVERDIEYFYPATFSPWKRQSEIAYLGSKLLCVGTVQPDGIGEVEACRKTGVKIMEGYFPVEDIRAFYDRTKHIMIPAVHGSERTVLEAMSMDILPVLPNAHLNKKASSYIEEYVTEKGNRSRDKFTPRDFILAHYSHHHFAKSILKGIYD